MADIVLATVATIAAASSHGAEFRVTEGAGRPICKSVVSSLEKLGANIAPGPGRLGTPWDWKTGAIRWRYTESDERTGNSLYALYDIDNDGNDEVVLFQSWTMRSNTNEALFIFKKNEIDFALVPRLSGTVLEKVPQISSGVEYPYSQHGLNLLMTAPFRYEGVNYVLIMDALFARKGFPDRSFVVAKLAGIPIRPGSYVDKLDVICNIKARKPFLPY